MSNNLKVLVWGIAVVAQLGVVAGMINTQETILRARYRSCHYTPRP